MRPSRILLRALSATLLLAALARRIGVEEPIWACGCWAAGTRQFDPYPAWITEHGTRRRRVDPNDHIHTGLTRAGAARRTSFWLAAR